MSYSNIQKLIALLASCLLMNLSSAAASESWPSINLPKSVRTLNVGEHITLNGTPMHLQTFVSLLSPKELTATFRQTLGQPLVETTLGSKQILGRAQGSQSEYYLTIEIEAASTGSRGTIAIADLKAARDQQAQTQADSEHWLRLLPPGSQLSSQMSSEDAGAVSHYFVFKNRHSEELNRDRLKSLMQHDGLVLEHVTAAQPQRNFSAKSTTLYFKGQGKEAMATVTQDGNGQSSIVINTISQLEHFK